MGKRADGRTTRTIALDKETLAFLEKLAEQKGSNVSNLIEEIANNIKKEHQKNEDNKRKNK